MKPNINSNIAIIGVPLDLVESTGTVLFDSNSINYQSKNLIKSNTVVL